MFPWWDHVIYFPLFKGIIASVTTLSDIQMAVWHSHFQALQSKPPGVDQCVAALITNRLYASLSWVSRSLCCNQLKWIIPKETFQTTHWVYWQYCVYNQQLRGDINSPSVPRSPHLASIMCRWCEVWRKKKSYPILCTRVSVLIAVPFFPQKSVMFFSDSAAFSMWTSTYILMLKSRFLEVYDHANGHSILPV